MSELLSRKYFSVFKISWEQGFIYRLNFVLWRVRSVLQLILIYFVWWTVFQSQTQVFGYTEKSIVTYILVAALIRAIILSTRVMDIAGTINEGQLSNFLVKPLSLIGYFFSRDIADKLLNISFVVVEVILFILLLKPAIIIQTNLNLLFLFLLATILGLILFFLISFTIGLFAFWIENSWGPFFLLNILMESLGGGLFPTDILPSPLDKIVLLTPFPYLIYFPAKVYLGDLGSFNLFLGFGILVFWVLLMWFMMRWILTAGLKRYSAEGH